MSVLEILRRVRSHLEENGRISLRMLRREFALDDDTLAEVIEELVDVQRVARREENVLVWAGAAAPSAPRPCRARTLVTRASAWRRRPRA